jgi:hypothetical protein
MPRDDFHDEYQAALNAAIDRLFAAQLASLRASGEYEGGDPAFDAEIVEYVTPMAEAELAQRMRDGAEEEAGDRYYTNRLFAAA